jgi:hypothetical protein
MAPLFARGSHLLKKSVVRKSRGRPGTFTIFVLPRTLLNKPRRTYVQQWGTRPKMENVPINAAAFEGGTPLLWGSGCAGVDRRG